MNGIKLTPLLLFILILIVLVISVVFGRINKTEGFIAFQKDKSSLEKVWIPQYAKTETVYKLNDNMFFDSRNGNFIELDASEYKESGQGATNAKNTTPIDRSGVTIDNVLVTHRDGLYTMIYNTKTNNGEPVDTDASKTTDIVSSYKSWRYDSQCPNTSKRNVLYIPWDKKTYIIIREENINSENGPSIYMFDSNNIAEKKDLNIPDFRFISQNILVDNTANVKVNEPLYNNKSVYTLGNIASYDINNGNILLTSDDKTKIKLFDRNGSEVNDAEITNVSNVSTVTNVEFKPWGIVSSSEFMMYIPYKDTTLVVIGKQARLELTNVKRFTPSGVESQTIETKPPPTQTKPPEVSAKPNVPTVTDPSEDSNYILKTQIVPPVCPSCPVCPEKVTCTNCGGQGGSGTLGATGSSMVGKETPGTSSKVQRDPRTGNLIRDVGSGTGNLIRDAASGADDLVRDAASGTVGLAKDAVGGTVGLAKDAVGGTVGLAKDAVGGLAGLLKFNPTALAKQQNQYLQTTSSRKQMGGPEVISNENYFGALPERQASDYMPITADFSAFAK